MTGEETEVHAGDIEIVAKEDRVKLRFQIGGAVGSVWGDTFAEALQNMANIEADHGDDIRPNAAEGRHVLTDEDFPKCANCGDYSTAEHHEWLAERVVKCTAEPKEMSA